MIREMTLADLDQVIGWAAEEGWNPGIDDAAVFLGCDPSGFLVKEIDGELVAAISVANHSRDYAFLGLYLCRAAHRGNGHRMELWRAGLEHAGKRTVGLDGVVDQQENYRKSGFVYAGRTVRYAGEITGWTTDFVRQATHSEVSHLVRMDKTASGVARPSFLTPWFRGARTRKTFVADDADWITGFATIRKCREGSKIGPFFAGERDVALQLLEGCIPPEVKEHISIDIPEEAETMIGLAEDLGLRPVFETARMYLGDPPRANPPDFYAVATLELG